MGKAGQVDVSIADHPAEAIGLEVTETLRSKGFCIVDMCLRDDVLEKARHVIEDATDAASKFTNPSSVVVDGLLGPEGSARIADLESFNSADEDQSLRMLDDKMSEIAWALSEYLPDIGIECTARTDTLIHQTDLPDNEQVQLQPAEAAEWLDTLMRHKIMILMPIGPAPGTLELRLFDEESQAYEIITSPGHMIILRADAMSHRHTCGSKATIMSCWLLEPRAVQRQKMGAASVELTPCAKALEDWVMDCLKDAKERQKENDIPQGFPMELVSAMNHLFHTGQRVAVRGLGLRHASVTDPECFFAMLSAGPDTITEVPIRRYNNYEVFDADPNAWRWGKTFLMHSSFMDGVELFDNKKFGISPAESSGMAPEQRQVLEAGYTACFLAGYNKGKMMNKPGGVYMGASVSMIGFAAEGVGATGGAASITSNRFSFCLGLKGPSMTTENEGASALVATANGAEAVLVKGRGNVNDFSLTGGVWLNLHHHWYPQLQAAGLLNYYGRCFSFDACADGYGLSDGIGTAVLEKMAQMVDGQPVMIEGKPLRGVIAASYINANGQASGLFAPHAPADQEMLDNVIKNAQLSPADIIAVEAHSAGGYMADAVEADSLSRSLRFSDDITAPLLIGGVKSNTGFGVENTGMISLMKVLMSHRAGYVTPNIHLSEINPQMDPDNKNVYITELTDYARASEYVGVTARGFGGVNAHVLTFGSMKEEVIPEASGDVELPKVSFWPGGGGALEDGQDGDQYFIRGTFTRWDLQEMDRAGEGCYSYKFTLGENMWEEFQIIMDGHDDQIIHPGAPQAVKGVAVQGPDGKGAKFFTWLVDARSVWVPFSEGLVDNPLPLEDAALAPPNETAMQLTADTQTSFYEVSTADRGVPGNTYKVSLQIAGKYRTVVWEKLKEKATVPKADYSVVGTWNGMRFQPMTKDSESVFTLEVTQVSDYEEFQIVRNDDWRQVIYPESFHADADCPIAGPDDASTCRGLNWCISGVPGDVYRLKFTREVKAETEDGIQDIKAVSWEKVRSVTLTDQQRMQTSARRFSVVGSWDNWAQPMILAAQSSTDYFFCVVVQEGIAERFQLLVDVDFNQMFVPFFADAGPVSRGVAGPVAAVDAQLGSKAWAIQGDETGVTQIFCVRVFASNGCVHSVTWSQVDRSSAEAAQAESEGRMCIR